LKRNEEQICHYEKFGILMKLGTVQKAEKVIAEKGIKQV
jgi:hypothetical protein